MLPRSLDFNRLGTSACYLRAVSRTRQRVRILTPQCFAWTASVLWRTQSTGHDFWGDVSALLVIAAVIAFFTPSSCSRNHGAQHNVCYCLGWGSTAITNRQYQHPGKSGQSGHGYIPTSGKQTASIPRSPAAHTDIVCGNCRRKPKTGRGPATPPRGANCIDDNR